jgi:hypothetical protein
MRYSRSGPGSPEPVEYRGKQLMSALSNVEPAGGDQPHNPDQEASAQERNDDHPGNHSTRLQKCLRNKHAGTGAFSEEFVERAVGRIWDINYTLTN